MEHMSLNIIFFIIFGILLEVHIVQLGITFEKHIEIHLIHKIYQIYSKNLETPTSQLKYCLLHVKNKLVYT